MSFYLLLVGDYSKAVKRGRVPRDPVVKVCRAIYMATVANKTVEDPRLGNLTNLLGVRVVVTEAA
ncbi:MAG: hypothetical protein ACRC2U_05085 [Aeromonas sp.]